MTIRVWAIPRLYGASGSMWAIHTATYPASISPEKSPVRMPIRVMPIWMVERKRSGFSARRKAVRAGLLPFLASISRRARREEMMAISDMENTPLSKMSPRMMNISILVFLPNDNSTESLYTGMPKVKNSESRAQRQGGKQSFHPKPMPRRILFLSSPLFPRKKAPAFVILP